MSIVHRTVVLIAMACGVVLSAVAGARPLADAAGSETCPPGPPVEVRISPNQGPVGTRVEIRGRCFQRNWNSGYGIFLIRQFSKPRECEIIAAGRYHFRVNRNRVGRGWFKVARKGACFQHFYRRRVTPARYRVGFGCHACSVGRFRVTR